ncbi:sigma-54-dependent transcriptional regulator [Thermodesulfobacteriota bacterium]
MKKKATILVVDDEYGVRQSFNMVLKDKYNVFLAATGEEAIDIFLKNAVDLILLDIILPKISGLDLLEKFKEMDPNTEIIMVSAVKEIQTAVKAIKLGAYDYLVKPFVVEDILNIINRALEKHSLVKEVAYLRDELKRYHPFEKIICKDKKMNDILNTIATISDSDGPVLIQGQSGTGKELVARAMYKLSSRREHPFVVVNCAAIPETLMESEVFGHNKGAFTGASRTKLGKLEIADKGIVFLDDVDTLDISMQAKLLRVVQEKEFERLGSTKVIKIDVRFIAASNKDLHDLVKREEFREDLYYRLNVFPIQLPPLKERKRDIPLLLDHFSKLQAKNTGKAPKKFSNSAVKILMQHYDWPGNVRELQNLVERLSTIIKGNIIYPKDVTTFSIVKKGAKDMTLREAVDLFEKQYIREVLEIVNGNRKSAAKMLSIHRNTLQKKLNE